MDLKLILRCLMLLRDPISAELSNLISNFQSDLTYNTKLINILKLNLRKMINPKKRNLRKLSMLKEQNKRNPKRRESLTMLRLGRLL